MNTPSKAPTKSESPLDALPTLHLVVPPPSEQEAIHQALAFQPDMLVLRWRLASETLKLVSDAELTELMKQHLQVGGNVAVWHGGMALNHADLYQRLGQQWAVLCTDHLTWARIQRVDAPGTVPWTTLANRLDRPDESAVRQMFFSDGQQLPRWSGLSDELNLQARIAHAAWYQANLAPLQGAIDEEVARHSHAIANEDTEEDGADTLEINDGTTFASDDEAPHTHPSAPYGTSYHLSAGALSAARMDQVSAIEVVSAQLQPTLHATRWYANQWRPGGRIVQGATPPLVEIKLDPGHIECRVSVILPASLGARRWALRFYPNEGLPFTLPFESKDGQTDAQPAWPADPSLKPDVLFWQSIKSGGVGLDRLS